MSLKSKMKKRKQSMINKLISLIKYQIQLNQRDKITHKKEI